MAITLTATLLTASNPQPVQVVLNGTTTGQAYEIRGTTADGSSWAVPGGKGTSAGVQVSVIDNRSAPNVAITYQVVVDGVTYTATPVTVTWAGDGVLQTLDGLNIVDIKIASATEPFKQKSRNSVFEIAGRAYPAARLDVLGSAEYTWQFDTQATNTPVMKAILAAGLPVVRRLTPGIRDLQSVVIGIISGDVSSELLTNGVDTWRRWTLTVREITDPQPSAVIAAYVWDSFDTAMNKPRTWSYFGYTLGQLASWTSSSGTLSQQTSGGYQAGGPFVRLTASTNGVGAALWLGAPPSSTLSLPCVAGQVVTMTARVKGTVGRGVIPQINWFNGAGGVISTSSNPSSATVTAGWTQITWTATAPATTAWAGFQSQMVAASTVAGDTLDVDGITLSIGSGVPVGTFDEMFSTWDQFDTADWAQYF